MSTFRLLRGMSVLRMKAYVLELCSELTIQRYSFSEIFEIIYEILSSMQFQSHVYIQYAFLLGHFSFSYCFNNTLNL